MNESERIGDYKPGRIPIAIPGGQIIYVDPPELFSTEARGLATDCEHDFRQPTITGERDFFGAGWHLAILTQACRHCKGIRKQHWKTATWYEGPF